MIFSCPTTLGTLQYQAADREMMPVRLSFIGPSGELSPEPARFRQRTSLIVPRASYANPPGITTPQASLQLLPRPERSAKPEFRHPLKRRHC
jgi:hypothetical protein